MGDGVVRFQLFSELGAWLLLGMDFPLEKKIFKWRQLVFRDKIINKIMENAFTS